MDNIYGVLTHLTMSGTILPSAKDGFIGYLSGGDQTVLEAYVLEPELNIYGFTVDGKKNVVLKKDWALVADPPLNCRKYLQKITVKISEEGVAHTEYPNNNMRIISVDDNGQTQISEVALISQNGYFFLTIQTTYEFQCYHQGKILTAPMFDSRWPQLVQFIRGLPMEISKLPDFSEYAPSPAQKKRNLEPQTGRVLWFNFSQGIGAIETSEGNARVHWSQIKPRPRLAYLEPNELVSYKKLMEPVQTKARNTSFPRDALGVKVL